MKFLLKGVVGSLVASISVLAIAAAPALAATPQLADGVYLYGQSDKPNQAGQDYFVFEVKQNKVVGALYQTNSSFDCASGQFENKALALSIVGTYDRTVYPHTMALSYPSSTLVAGNRPMLGLPLIDGLQRITTISQNDRRMLSVCKASYRAK